MKHSMTKGAYKLLFIIAAREYSLKHMNLVEIILLSINLL